VELEQRGRQGSGSQCAAGVRRRSASEAERDGIANGIRVGG
jgi:hypothetical protein